MSTNAHLAALAAFDTASPAEQLAAWQTTLAGITTDDDTTRFAGIWEHTGTVQSTTDIVRGLRTVAVWAARGGVALAAFKRAGTKGKASAQKCSDALASFGVEASRSNIGRCLPAAENGIVTPESIRAASDAWGTADGPASTDGADILRWLIVRVKGEDAVSSNAGAGHITLAAKQTADAAAKAKREADAKARVADREARVTALAAKRKTTMVGLLTIDQVRTATREQLTTTRQLIDDAILAMDVAEAKAKAAAKQAESGAKQKESDDMKRLRESIRAEVMAEMAKQNA